MGICRSSAAVMELPNSWLQLFEIMNLTKREIRKFLKLFRTIDVDHTGCVEVGDLLTLLDIERTKFTRRIFSVFDSERTGRIDFHEFVMAVWNYCTLGKASLVMFTFDLYDWEQNGELSTDEAQQMLEDYFGDQANINPQAKIMALDIKKILRDGPFDLEVFQLFTKSHQSLLFRTFTMQLRFRKAILGNRFWKKLSKRRIILSNGRYISMKSLLSLHVDKELRQRVLEDSKVIKLSKTAKRLIRNTGTAYDRHTVLNNDSDNHHHSKLPTGSHVRPPVPVATVIIPSAPPASSSYPHTSKYYVNNSNGSNYNNSISSSGNDRYATTNHPNRNSSNINQYDENYSNI